MIKRLLRLVGRWARKPVNHTSWVAVVTPTDRPKSVRNRCLIELFCGVVCVVTLPFWHFCWCRGFCHRTESDLFLFLSNMPISEFWVTIGDRLFFSQCHWARLFFLAKIRARKFFSKKTQAPPPQNIKWTVPYAVRFCYFCGTLFGLYWI